MAKNITEYRGLYTPERMAELAAIKQRYPAVVVRCADAGWYRPMFFAKLVDRDTWRLWFGEGRDAGKAVSTQKATLNEAFVSVLDGLREKYQIDVPTAG